MELCWPFGYTLLISIYPQIHTPLLKINSVFGIGLIGSTLEKPIVFSFTIKTAIDYAFAQRPVFYCCSNNGQQTITVGVPDAI